MLLRFAVSNFLSFKDTVEFRMAAGKKIIRHANHVSIVGDGKKLLKGGFIFGANAAGKSNLVRAMDFARSAVLKGTSKGDCHKSYFRIDGKCKDEPGVFQFDIYAGGHFYSYGFAVSYKNAEIEEEWLYHIGGEEELIFERGRDESGKMRVASDIDFKDDKEKTQFEVYSEAIDSDEMKQKMFLSDMAMRSRRGSKNYKPFKDVRNWFNELLIIYPESRFNNMSELVRDEDERLTLEHLLRYFDTGIEALTEIERDFDKIVDKIPEEKKTSLKEDILEYLEEKDNDTRYTIRYQGSFYEIKLKDGDLVVVEVVSDHGNPADQFELEDESDGTRRLFDLLPIFRIACSNRVIVVDELDRSLHTKATLELINRFYEETEGCNSQLIATTHDSNILDLDLLRQDEIWLVERQDDHSSAIKPLNAYKPRFDKDVKKQYLIGRYGAVPIFGRLALLEDEDGEPDGE